MRPETDKASQSAHGKKQNAIPSTLTSSLPQKTTKTKKNFKKTPVKNKNL